jgi:hypothetical protein
MRFPRSRAVLEGRDWDRTSDLPSVKRALSRRSTRPRRRTLPRRASRRRQRLTRALAVLFAVFGSGVELETCAVLVTKPLLLLGAVIVIVYEAVPLCASEG